MFLHCLPKENGSIWNILVNFSYSVHFINLQNASIFHITLNLPEKNHIYNMNCLENVFLPL